MAVKLLVMTVAILISVHDTYQQSILSVTPSNKAAVLGSNVTFQCQVTQDDALTDYISWEECITTDPGDCLRISNDEVVVYTALGGDAARGARYSIKNDTTNKQFDLMITGIESEDAGQYRCLSRNNAEAYFSAELVVLDSIPLCECHTNDNLVLMTCEVDYYGTQSPVVEFNIEGSIIPPEIPTFDATVSGSTGGHMEYNITIPQGSVTYNVLYATVNFTSFPGGDRIASNAPAYEYVESCNITGLGEITTNPQTTKTWTTPISEEITTNPQTTETWTTPSEPTVTTNGPPRLEIWVFIVIGVGAAVLIIVIIIIIVVCVKAQNKKKLANTGNVAQPSVQTQLPNKFSEGYVNSDYQ